MSYMKLSTMLFVYLLTIKKSREELTSMEVDNVKCEFGDFRVTGNTKIGRVPIYTIMALAKLSFETILIMPAGGLLKIVKDIESGVYA